MSILTIISHTEHYKDGDGTIVGWGPTVQELNHLLEVFDIIYHVAMLYPGQPPESSHPYVSNRIIFIPLPAVGGPKLRDKMQIIVKSFTVVQIINSTLRKTDYFQLRTPTGIGVFLIPYLTLFVKKKGWYKYAGNWNQKNPPLGYALQRWMLKQQTRKVTINGAWPEQPKHCLTFENPCLTLSDINEGELIIRDKSIEGKLHICYVGRLEKPKGVERIIKSIDLLSPAEKQRIEAVHLVGDGKDMTYFKTIAADKGVNFIFHEFLSRKEVFDIYKKSQVFMMPTTASEGFPKVIAEAVNFGCIPIVSTVSSIGQYVKHLESGYCLNEVNSDEIIGALRHVFHMNNEDYQLMLTKQRLIIEKFTFVHYNKHIRSKLLD
ncbi:glycosyltransferase [Gelidibacter japonicus]|uniref:glycosyltransferase n=1 Tax=Gelidibacter japonicus TaxID=1962232 RepID=UPI003A9068D9